MAKEKFIIKCNVCGSESDFDEVDFIQGGSITFDKMLITCKSCGNFDRRSILWPLEILPVSEEKVGKK